LLEWFIVAFISFPNTDRIEVQLMQDSFKTRPACIQYLTENPSVINDIQTIAPTNNGMMFQCLDTDQVMYYRTKKQEI